jgi:hypothetical protein
MRRRPHWQDQCEDFVGARHQFTGPFEQRRQELQGLVGQVQASTVLPEVPGAQVELEDAESARDETPNALSPTASHLSTLSIIQMLPVESVIGSRSLVRDTDCSACWRFMR